MYIAIVIKSSRTPGDADFGRFNNHLSRTGLFFCIQLYSIIYGGTGSYICYGRLIETIRFTIRTVSNGCSFRHTIHLDAMRTAIIGYRDIRRTYVI